VGFKTKKNDKGIALESLLNLVGSWLNSGVGGDARTSVLQVLHSTLRIVPRNKFDDLVETLPIAAREVLFVEANRVRNLVEPSSSSKGLPIRTNFSVVCEFCNRADPSFISQVKLDLHYWEECPSLIECRFCEQIVEIVGLTEHRLKECEAEREANIFN
jgi:hypothetical protein